MRSLNDTLKRLAALRGAQPGNGELSRLTELLAFGSNPGALRGLFYVPEQLDDHAALVVVLHGCTQDAAGYDRGSGWSRFADEQGFALLFPEQQRTNNPNLCFNWFNRQDTRRGSGEALSIRQMVASMVANHRIDPARVYVTGLSAGGAMASVMLATYPDVFAGGAIIAGLPYGTANSVPEAFDRMRAHGGPEPAVLGDLVKAASDHRGPWPTISVWHGDSDMTVSDTNAALVVEQWRAVHGLAEQPGLTEQVAGYPRRVWHDAAGREVIEEYRIAGLGHGTPLSTSAKDAQETAGPFMLEAGISSTRRIARFWGLTRTSEVTRVETAPGVAVTHDLPEQRVARPEPLHRVDKDGTDPASSPVGVGRVIEDALRAAGLMR